VFFIKQEPYFDEMDKKVVKFNYFINADYLKQYSVLFLKVDFCL